MTDKTKIPNGPEYVAGLEDVTLAAIQYCGMVERYGPESDAAQEQYALMNDALDRWANRDNPNWRPA